MLSNKVYVYTFFVCVLMAEMCGKALSLKQNLLEVFMSLLGLVILQVLICYSEFIYQNCQQNI